MRTEKEEYVITDQSEFCSVVCCRFFFRSFSSFHRGFCFERSQLNYIKTKRCTSFFFFGNFPGQKRSFFSFSLFLIQFFVCKTFLIFFFFFLSVVCCDSKDHFSTLCSHSSFVKKPGFMQNTHASFDHKGSCWCIKI